MTTREYAAGRPLSIPPRYATVNTASGKQVHPDVIVHLEVAASLWGDPRKSPHQKWNVYLGDELIVSRHRDPSHAACCALLARGITGRMLTVHPDGSTGMVMDVEKGAKLTVIDDDRRGLRVVEYRPYDATGNTPAVDLIEEML